MTGAKNATRKLAGWMWLAAWCALLYLIHSPWWELGGLVSERLRWWERFVLPMGFVVGCYACSYNSLLPVAGLTAMVLVALRVLGLTDAIGVVFTAFAAYWAGIDIACGAYPLMMGERDGRSSEVEQPPPWLGV